jgi:toxin YoeB
MNILFSARAWEDYGSWQRTDRKIAEKIHAVLKDISRNPYTGIGKPEPLKFALSGYGSRRITEEHRLVYGVEGGLIKVAQARYHYE